MWRRKRALRGLDEDIEDHIARETADHVARGLSPAEARREALVAFGNVALVKEHTREVWTSRWFEQLRQDVRYAVRTLRRSPGFTAVAVATLALGIGANTAIVSLANGLLFRDLGVPNLDRLVAFTPANRASSIGAFGLSAQDIRAIEARKIPGIEHVFTSNPLLGALSTADQSGHVAGELVSGEYFQALGLRPLVGRLLTIDDDRNTRGGAAIVISERLWQRWFNRHPSVIGARARMAGYPLTIVGVVSSEFRGTWLPTILAADLWAPVSATASLRTVQGPVGDPAQAKHRTFARVSTGLSLAHLNGLLASVPLATTTQGGQNSRVLSAVPAERAIYFDQYKRPGLLIGSAVVALASMVFLISCANLTNLLLARVTARTEEVGIRLALGAGRSRVFRLLLVEVAVLTALAGVVGIGLACGVTKLLAAFPIPELDGVRVTFDPSPDWRVFTYAFAIAAAATFAVGLAPAWQASRTDPLRVINATGFGASTIRGRLRGLLVGSQMAMSIVLVVLAGIYVRSAVKGFTFDPGYDTTSTVLASVDFRVHKIDEARGRQLNDRILAAARAVSGVTAAGLATSIPAVGLQSVANGDRVAFLAAEGAVIEPQRPPLPLPDGRVSVRARTPLARYAAVSPGFFQTLGIRIARGRSLTDADGAGAPRVVVISESVAETLWPRADPIGQRLRMREDGPLFEVVGVAPDVRTALRALASDLFLYVPIAQDFLPRVSVVVRTAGTPEAVVEPLRQAIRSVEPELAVSGQTVADAIGFLLAPIRATAWILGGLGSLGLGIALLGVYGMVAYSSSQRIREFGIRKALGATTAGIYGVILRSSLWTLILGVVPGLVVAFLAAGLLRNLVYGIDARDPLTFVAVPIVLILAGVSAAALAARRAARTEPHDALRSL